SPRPRAAAPAPGEALGARGAAPARLSRGFAGAGTDGCPGPAESPAPPGHGAPMLRRMRVLELEVFVTVAAYLMAGIPVAGIMVAGRMSPLYRLRADDL